MMMINRMWVATAVALAGMGILLTSGCGVATAPASLPAAVASNANFSFQGTVVDVNGRPLEGVVMKQTLNHLFWAPVSGSRTTDEQKLKRVDGRFNVSERGERLTVAFSKDGYLDYEAKFDATDADVVRTPAGKWPNAKPFPVVMLPKEADADLRFWMKRLDYSGYPSQTTVNLQTLVAVDVSSVPTANSREGSFYLTLEKEAPKAKNAKGDLDPVDVNLPSRLTLHLDGAGSGFVRISPRLGYGPLQTADEAPAEGYSSTLDISRERLREMRTADPERVMESREHFYFKAGDHYGKGAISWGTTVTKADRSIPKLDFRLEFWVQRNPNQRNLKSRNLQWMP